MQRVLRPLNASRAGLHADASRGYSVVDVEEEEEEEEDEQVDRYGNEKGDLKGSIMKRINSKNRSPKNRPPPLYRI